jgi:hypothetical protein
LHVLAQMLICSLLARLWTSRSQHAPHARTIYTVLKLHGKFLMYCLLGSMVACLLVSCTSRERSCYMVHYNCLDSLTAGLNQTAAFCMIARFYHDLYQGALGWFCGLASELELAHSGAVHSFNSPVAGPWCQCQGAAPRPTGAHFTPSKKTVLEHLLYCHLSTTPMTSDIKKYKFSDIQSWASGATRV